MARTFVLVSLLASAALVGCTSDDAEPGSPCKADLTCGSGLVCDFQAAEPKCLDPDLDLDGDGLKNGDDRCPATNASSNHDEDGDGQGDACDKCPIERYRAAAGDNDKDGVAGLCDPDDQDPGDKIVFFDAFDKPDNGWTFDDAAHFQIADGMLKATVTAADPTAEAKHSLPTATDSMAAFTAYRMVNAMPSGVDSMSREVTLTVFDPSPAAGGGYMQCGPVSENGGAGRLSVATDSGRTTEALLSAFAQGDPAYRLLVQSQGSSARCVQTRGTEATLASTSVQGALRLGVALSLRSVHANYEYVLVVSSPQR